MAKKFENYLTGRLGEYLACAELGRKGYIATSFSGNVPEFDLLIVNKKLQILPMQVKTSKTGSWRANANEWLNITVDDNDGSQKDNGDKEIENPTLIYMYISLGKESKDDRFFILNKKQLQEVIGKHYRLDMDGRNWKRPKNYKSFDCRFKITEIQQYEDNWKLIEEQIETQYH